jgi:UDP-2-acetamido-3-amino-2,3-dideoxy-glucuronate N-acetyltransferase
MLVALNAGDRANPKGSHMGIVHAKAVVDDDVTIHPSASVWAGAQVRSGAFIGADCIVGMGAYIGLGVHVAARAKIQNYALIYEPAMIGEGVFIGPGAILTNDHMPRAVRTDGALKSPSDWTAVGVTVETGASIGAGAVCVAPVRIGEWSMIGAGAVVTRDVARYALVVGNPARQIGWVSRSGQRLIATDTDGVWTCPDTGRIFHEHPDGTLHPE